MAPARVIASVAGPNSDARENKCKRSQRKRRRTSSHAVLDVQEVHGVHDRYHERDGNGEVAPPSHGSPERQSSQRKKQRCEGLAAQLCKNADRNFTAIF